METIPPIFWMAMVTLFVGFVCFVLYQVGMVVRESRDTITKSNKIIDDVGEITGKTKDMVNNVEGTVTSVLAPFKVLGTLGDYLTKLLASFGLVTGVVNTSHTEDQTKAVKLDEDKAAA
jgi:uncharacterized protein YoxC